MEEEEEEVKKEGGGGRRGGSQLFRVFVAKSDVAHKWADGLHNSCHLGVPQYSTLGNQPRIGELVVSCMGYPTRAVLACSPGFNQRDKITNLSGRIGSVTPTFWAGPQRFTTGDKIAVFAYISATVYGFPTPLQHGIRLELAHKWADWPFNPCCLWVPNKVVQLKVVHKWASWPNSPSCTRGSTTLQRDGQNLKLRTIWRKAI